ncbi:unnamed protein product [Clonostachys chloroleuca]|uniref:FAD dependent oxidoreductase domain-containing protein n=1 Tax=Clonostachys chloroleuca TaxID=1926264 RepID=A0AA35LT93_9HYPO|nr:unnamed protein product [Clonostachys chloroleuca]
MGFSLGRCPLVGKLPSTSLPGQKWVSVGYEGYGMVNAFLCGQALADMIFGHPFPDLPQASLLTPERLKKL